MSACLLLPSCCENERPFGHLSPDGKWKYVTFSRNCGATTADNFQVSVLPATALMPTEAGNAFIADDNHGEAAFVADLECWGRRETAPFQPVLAGATGARRGMPIAEDAVRTL